MVVEIHTTSSARWAVVKDGHVHEVYDTREAAVEATKAYAPVPIIHVRGASFQIKGGTS